jgi:transcription factor HY5
MPAPVHQQHVKLNGLELAELRIARARAARAEVGKRSDAAAARAKRVAAIAAGRGARRAAAASMRGGAGGGRPSETDDEGGGDGFASPSGWAPGSPGVLGGEYQTDAELRARLAATSDLGEAKRLKRLLRNRVSAQQARERKKNYVDNLEVRAVSAEARAGASEARASALEREADMLRTVIKNMRGA